MDSKIGESVKKLVVGVSWDLFDPESSVDLDASCVLFNNFGQIVDAVYYNQLEISDKSVVHSGDNKTGEGEGFDETITVDFEKMDKSVVAAFLIITCYSGGSFLNVETATSTIVNPADNSVIYKDALGCKGKHTKRLGAGKENWFCRKVGTIANGKHFKDVEKNMKRELEFFIPKEIQDELAYSTKNSKAFDLKKGQNVRLGKCGKITLGLGWDTQCDIDSSCVPFDAEGNVVRHNDSIDVVMFNHKKNSNSSVVHSGDNLTGEGEGDDEQINVDLEKIPENTRSLFFVITVFTPGNSFRHVSGAFVRLVDHSNSDAEVCRYNLSRTATQTAQVTCVVYRDFYDVWRMKAVGEETDGPRKASETDLLFFLKSYIPKNSLNPGCGLLEKIAKLESAKSELENTSMYLPRETKKFIEFRCSGKKLDKTDVLGLSDPYFYIYDGERELYKSEIRKVTLNPKFDTFEIEYVAPHKTLTIKLYDWDRNSSDDYMGSFQFKLKDVLGTDSDPVTFTVINEEKKAKKKKYKDSGTFIMEAGSFDKQMPEKENPRYRLLKEKIKRIQKEIRSS